MNLFTVISPKAGVLLVTLLLSACGGKAPANNAATEPQRIISLGGEISETLVALGLEARLVAVDSTSLYPPRLGELPNVGYLRQLNTEAVAALAPDLIIASHDAGPAHVLEQWRHLGIRVEQVSTGPGIDQALTAIERVGTLVGRTDAGRRIAAENRAAISELRSPRNAAPPRVLFLLNNAGNQPLVAGRGTKADAMIKAAGGINVAADISGYKPGSAEAITAMAPDTVLVASHAVESFGGESALHQHSALRHTPAGESGRIAVVDSGLILNLGPRLADGVKTLRRAIITESAEQQVRVN